LNAKVVKKYNKAKEFTKNVYFYARILFNVNLLNSIYFLSKKREFDELAFAVA